MRRVLLLVALAAATVRADVNVDGLVREISAALKTNGLECAARAADEFVAHYETDGDAKGKLEKAFAKTILPAFAAKKVMGAAYTRKYYGAFAAILEKRGKSVPYEAALAHLDFLWTYDLEPLETLRAEADKALREVRAQLAEKNRHAIEPWLLARRAKLFGGVDYERYRAEDERLSREKGLLVHYAAFPDEARILNDAALTDVQRATTLYRALVKLPFAEKEALLERALKTPDLSEADRISLLENLASLERSGLPRNWIGEVPKRFNGTKTVANADPIAYAKALAAQKELVALAAEGKKETLAKRYLELLDLSYTALATADVAEAFTALERALGARRDLWEVRATAYLAASAYFDEDYERASRLFHRFSVETYRGKDRASRRWWYTIVEPYIRTAIAVGEYDEAYLLRKDITEGMLEGWESWHRARYRAMFAELAKLCRKETLETGR